MSRGFKEFIVEVCIIRCQRLCQSRSRRLISVMILTVAAVLIFQNFSLSSKSGFSTQIPPDLQAKHEGSSLNKDLSSIKDQNLSLSETQNLSETLNHQVTVGEMDSIELDGNENRDTEFSILRNGSKDDNGKENSQLVADKTGVLGNVSDNLQEELGVNKNLEMHPLSMSEMHSLLCKIRASYPSMLQRHRSLSAPEKQIMIAREKIENAPIVEADGKLYPPMYRNFSKFKRSYELMEKTLKIYVYREGEKPIFHQPVLKGIYASEGWFMKLMESNKHYLVKNPARAHLFYIPLSSRLLQVALYVPDSHNRTKLRLHLKSYVDLIASKYPFWNRSAGGGDHFVVACHDWALDVTNNSMDRSIRAVCVSDLHMGFRFGRDVSLPETNVRSPKNPLKDLGGRAWNQRPILAFFAGNLHGGLRDTILKQWENNDPDMKIFGPAFARMKMDYIQHMKGSKYCICPRGYEANSPRLMEAFFFECVPVIIADDYVPPFFEVLDWERFSVVVLEKDVPRLKEILLSITEAKYRELQMGVKKVQQHFLWHSKPSKLYKNRGGKSGKKIKMSPQEKNRGGKTQELEEDRDEAHRECQTPSSLLFKTPPGPLQEGCRAPQSLRR